MHIITCKIIHQNYIEKVSHRGLKSSERIWKFASILLLLDYVSFVYISLKRNTYKRKGIESERQENKKGLEINLLGNNRKDMPINLSCRSIVVVGQAGRSTSYRLHFSKFDNFISNAHFSYWNEFMALVDLYQYINIKY